MREHSSLAARRGWNHRRVGVVAEDREQHLLERVERLLVGAAQALGEQIPHARGGQAAVVTRSCAGCTRCETSNTARRHRAARGNGACRERRRLLVEQLGEQLLVPQLGQRHDRLLVARQQRRRLGTSAAVGPTPA